MIVDEAGAKRALVEAANPLLERAGDEECLATWFHQATPGTTYWRCLVPARHLPGQTIPFTIFDLAEREDGIPYLPRQRGDTTIWQFLGDGQRSKVAFAMRDIYGTRTLMDVDDNYLRAAPYMRGKPWAPWKETHEEAQRSGTGYSHEVHREVASWVDGVITATDYLADAYSEFNDNIYVCPNSIDLDDWQYERAPSDGVFRIAYYGSSSHVADTPILTKAMKWAARQPGVEVWTVGFDPPAWSFPHHVLPWEVDPIVARENLFKFDLGLAPLKGNPWSRGKSDIKVMEYGMAGVLPLMSRETPFKPWFDHFPDLIVDDNDWLATVRWAILNQDDVRARAADVKDHILEHRVIDKTIHLWHEALNG